ncbi:MAG: hypothetical protein ACRDHS_14730 [Actinomycetota bacterium]
MAGQDAELVAMQQVVAALSDLDEETRARVLEWTAKRFKVSIGRVSRRPARNGAGSSSGNEDTDEPEDELEFEHFADLLDAANPNNNDDRALVGGYWFRVVKGGGNFTGGAVNNQLKDTGHGVENITRVIDHLKARTPAEVRQLAKSGRAKQARKTYKLTSAGIEHVERMIGGVGVRAGADEVDDGVDET